MSDSRVHLPPTRRNCTIHVRIDGTSVYLCYGMYEDNSLGELFIDVNKQGTAVRAWTTDIARVTSLAIQSGVPLQRIVDMFLGSVGEPRGKVVGHRTITSCTGVMDFVAKCIQEDFLA